VLLLPPHAGPLRLVVIASLLLLSTSPTLIWLIRPTALHTVPARSISPSWRY
jgi:hypothetical protein